MSAPKQGQGFQLTQTQTLVISPQMTQRLHILQCNQQQLDVEIQQMLDKNIMLDQPDGIEIEFDADTIQTDTLDDLDSLPDGLSETPDADIDWKEIYDDDNYLESFSDKQKKTDDTEGFQDDWVPQTDSFDEIIERAIYLSDLNDNERQIAKIIIERLDSNYFLTEPVEQLSKTIKCDLSTLNYVIDIIKHLEPAGVASTGIRDCLLAQIQCLEINDIVINAHEIIRFYFDYIDKKPEFICKRLQLSESEYHSAMQLIRTLSPYPTSPEVSVVQSIKPEVFVRQRMGMFYASSNQDVRYDLVINETYADLTKNCKGDEKRFMKAQLQEAKFFINAISQRQKTVVRVANVIVMQQQEYFIEGEKAMRPLVMREVAEQLELSESTISRAVSGKYLSFNKNLIEMKFFFTQGLSTTDDSNGNAISDEGVTSSTAAKAHIKEIINAENPSKPLSDSSVEALLKERGIEISRRTVTKYREALGIQKTSLRKRTK